MELKELQKNWDEFGRRDPLWAILTSPGKRDGKWDRHEFFKTGEDEISSALDYVNSLGIPLSRNRALDFGCGVGRLTQALCHYFDQCYGVDIAPSMVGLAEKYNRYGSRCRYYLNDSNDLRLFSDHDFDFIYSNIVLQHMEPNYSKGYIREFLRVLAPGGVLIFQIPSEPIIGPCDALPDSAFRAEINTDESSVMAKPASVLTIRVRVKNISDTTWPAPGASAGRYSLHIGDHWLDADGKLLVNDDARASLPEDLGPLDEIDLYLDVNTPSEPGAYILELDMVQEGVAWFKDRGSETRKVRVEVKAIDGKAANHNASGAYSEGGIIPTMEMYGVHRREVSEIILSGGGMILDVQEDLCAGPEWVSFRYCVTKK